MSCLKPNINALTVVGLPDSAREVHAVEDLFKIIIDQYDDQFTYYSLNEESSLKPEDYKKSASNFIEKVMDKVANLSIKELQLSPGDVDYELLKNDLELYYYSKWDITRDVEQDLNAVIDGETLSRDEIQSKKLDETLDLFFANNLPAKDFFMKQFSRQLGLCAVIRIGETLADSSIVDSEQALNENIERFLHDQYLTVFRYLKSRGLSKGLSNSIFKNHKEVSTYLNTLDTFYNEVANRSKLGILQEQVESDWQQEIANNTSNNVTLLQAINAYLSIVYFDKLSQQTIGKYISYDKYTDKDSNTIWKFPIYIDKDGKYHYKYHFGKDTENRVHGWQIDVRDALKEMGNFSKFLISSIPIDDDFLTPVSFLGAFTKLFSLTPSLVGDKELGSLYRYLVNYNANPVNNLRGILSEITTNNNVRKAITSLSETKGELIHKLNQYDLKVLDTVYEHVFNRKNSLYNIESNYNRIKGIRNRYPLVESLAAQIGSSTDMNYFETVYDYDIQAYKIGIKKKFYTKKDLYDMVNAVNSTNYTNTQTNYPYSIKSVSASEYVVSTNSSNIRINIDPVHNPFGLLTKNVQDKGITITLEDNTTHKTYSLRNLLSSVNLVGQKRREALLNAPSGTGKLLLDVLHFIDDFAGTSFTLGTEGLRELNIFKENYPNGINEAFASACRGLLINDINKNFYNKVEDGKYNPMQLRQYLKDYNVYPYKAVYEMNDASRDWKSFWEVSTTGPQLKTLRYTQLWIDHYIQTKQIMSGEISRANTKNLAGDSLPNYGLAFMGANYHALINDSQHGGVLQDNIFKLNPEMVIGTTIDTDVRLPNGDSKAVKNMTKSELFYHSIVNKFILPLIADSNNPYMIIQPTTYSDKTKFVNYMISAYMGKQNLLKATDEQLKQMYIDSIGKQYQSVLKNVLYDYAKIFNLEKWYNQAYVVKRGKTVGINNEAILTLTHLIDKNLKSLSGNTISELEASLNKLAKQAGVNVFVDTHYRTISSKEETYLTFNESLYNYAINLYTKKGLDSRLKEEKLRFLNSLLRNLFIIDNIRIVGKSPDPDNPWVKMLNTLGESSSWINSKGELILAKANGQDIVSHVPLAEGTNIVLNPILEKYFMLHSLLGNNLRLSLTGSEINHKNKELNQTNLGKKFIKYRNELLPHLKKLYPTITDENKLWNRLSYIDIEKIIPKLQLQTTKDAINKLKTKELFYIEAGSQGAQLKRNVSIPATMRYYTQNSIRGIAKTMNVAVMDDIQAKVFNLIGKSDSIDSHDGAAFINPITSILENWSLQENEVGNVKKPIWHFYDQEHMTASLVKFAAHTMTNNMMRQSLGSNVNMYHMFRKMANKSWEIIPEIGIGKNILAMASHTPEGIITLNDLTNGNFLYYRGKNGTHYKIVDLGFEENEQSTLGTYYTDEFIVDKNGKGNKKVRFYHYFDVNGNHIASSNRLSDQELLDRKLHNVRSIYEVHSMLGGIESESLVDGKLVYSEASTFATASLVNNVTINPRAEAKKQLMQSLLKGKRKPTEEESELLKYQPELTQEHYQQPLKTLMIDYLCNNSAIKNGAGNRNSAERFNNDEDLNYIVLGTEYYGIQMDADHEADEAKMTEFSQVISALDAGGRLHAYIKGIYQALGQIAMEEAQIEMNAIEAYQKDPTPETRDALYDIIGRTIINNISTARGQAGLADSIIYQIKKRFNLSNSHKLDDLKIPFSDYNIYNNILSTYASIITGKSIRKQYPGLGAVLSPGYDIMMVYDIDGKVYQFTDILKQATIQYNAYKNRKRKNPETPDGDDAYYANISDDLSTTQWTKAVVDGYLMSKTNAYNAKKWKYIVPQVEGQLPDWDLHTEEFQPTDNIGIKYRTTDGTEAWEDISLNDIDDYYLFKADPRAFLQDRLTKKNASLTLVGILQFRKNIHKARNLAPSKIGYTYEEVLVEKGKPVTRYKSIFDTAPLIEQFLNNIKDPTQKAKIQGYLDRVRAKGDNYTSTQQVLDDLDKGYITSNVNGATVQIPIKLQNSPAELIMSNIYQSRFNISVEQSLVDILNNRDHFVPNKARRRQVAENVTPDFYDLVMTKANGHHTYISIGRTFETTKAEDDEDLPDVTYQYTSWRNKHSELNEHGKVLNDIYALNKQNKKLFKVGRDIYRDDITYNVEGNFYYIGNNEANIISSKGLRYENGRVIERVEFVSQHIIKQNGKSHTVYNINESKLKDVFEGTYEEYNNYLADLIKEIYEADAYELLTLNENMISQKNLSTLKELFKNLATRFDYNQELSTNLQKIEEAIVQIPKTNEFHRPDLKLENGNIIFQEGESKNYIYNFLRNNTMVYLKKLGYKKYSSFLKSMYYTASRIPAQTLQSFMNMIQVGYTAEGSNLAYVSHWQTWLQGSDYDIDKAYVMGLAFDDNGNYVGWSNLFDYYDLDTIRASEYLPLPNGKILIQQDDNGVDISEESKIISEIESKLKAVPSEDPNALQPYAQEEVSAARVLRLNAYAKIFDKLGKVYGYEDISVWNVKGASKDIIDALNSHNKTALPVGIKAMALRNFISTHIQNTIQHVRNASDAYTPVKTKDIGDPAKDSPKGKEGKEINLMNPLDIYTMQYENMTGKNVIGVSANGQKGSFMWLFYSNDVIKNAKLDKDYYFDANGNLIPIHNSQLDYVSFSFNSSRIKGRGRVNGVEGIPQEITINTLPDVNLEGIQDINFINKIQEGKQQTRIPVDIIISQMKSSATDNAKELILAKINAGNKLAKCYLFLMSVGFDINDIVAFMTSDIVSWIDILSESNVFTAQNISVDKALTAIEKFLNAAPEARIVKDYIYNQYMELEPTSYQDKHLNKLLRAIIPIDENGRILLSEEKLAYIKQDLNEFRKVLRASDEFSKFGRLLSINQGLPSKTEDLEAKLNSIRKIISDAEQDSGLYNKQKILNKELFDQLYPEGIEYFQDIMGGRFDPVKWLQNEEYRKRVSAYYNPIKSTINIFAIADYLPHFSKMFKLLGGECTVNNFSTRSRILARLIEDAYKSYPDLYIDDQTYTRMLRFATDVIINNYISNGKFQLPIRGEIINKQRCTYSSEGLLNLDSEESIASFKYYFENTIIPGIKAGTYISPDWENLSNEEISKIQNSLRYNIFVQSLMRGNDGVVPIYKTNINVSSQSSYTQIQLAKYSKALQQLSNIKIGEHSLSDWFALYNLIVNKNQYGSDRLTKVLEVFIKEMQPSAIINDYLIQVGKLDYKGDDVSKIMQFSLRDMLIATAPVVTHLEGQDAQIVLKYDEAGYPKYYEKSGTSYTEMGDLLPTITGESIEQRLNRFILQRSYFVLSKPYTEFVLSMEQALNTSPIDAIYELLRSATIDFDIKCV